MLKKLLLLTILSISAIGLHAANKNSSHSASTMMLKSKLKLSGVKYARRTEEVLRLETEVSRLETALQEAEEEGEELEKEVQKLEKQSKTSLYMSASDGASDLVEEDLNKYGVDVNNGFHRVDGHETPLYAAVTENHPHVVEQLINAQANIHNGKTNINHETIETPLDAAFRLRNNGAGNFDRIIALLMAAEQK